MRDNLTIDELEKILNKCYCSKTAYPDVQKDWSEENKTLGQCAVTALVVQHFFGGDIYKHNKYSHYFNILNGQIIDLTKSQFNFKLDYSDSVIKQPNLHKAQTEERYKMLLAKVQNCMANFNNEQILEEIKKCTKCGDLPKLSCNSLQDKNSRVIILGESPAKDGWIVSGRAFYTKDGKLQATGKVLDKLLNLSGLSIDNINFTEVCKCIIADRKKLRICSENCRPILLKQLESINSDIILPMGQYPTETILGFRVNKLKEVVGKVFEIQIGGKKKIVIPIYHTSPANPLCYIGNEEIFKTTLNNSLNNF